MPPGNKVGTGVPRPSPQPHSRSDVTRQTITRPDTPRIPSLRLEDDSDPLLMLKIRNDGKVVNRPFPTRIVDADDNDDDIYTSPSDESFRAKLGELDVFSADGPHIKSVDDKNQSSAKRKRNEIDMRPHKEGRLITSLGEVVTLLVGKNAIKFIIHKDMLCAASPFFEAACKPEWQSAGESIVTLPEDDTMAVKIMLNWVYENMIRLPAQIFDPMDELDSVGVLLIKLYTLGDKYQMPMLQNDVIDVLACRFSWSQGYGMHTMNYAWKETSENSPLRFLLVTFAIRHWSAEKLESYKTHLCPEFTHSMAVELLKCPSKELPAYFTGEVAAGTFCTRFHRHDSTVRAECKSFKVWGFY